MASGGYELLSAPSILRLLPIFLIDFRSCVYLNPVFFPFQFLESNFWSCERVLGTNKDGILKNILEEKISFSVSLQDDDAELKAELVAIEQ